MDPVQWLTEAYDALATRLDAFSVVALDSVERALDALSDTDLYNRAHDEVELCALVSPLHADALWHLL